MRDFKVIVCGDRNGYKASAVRKILSALKQDHPNLLVMHGGARGVDEMAGAMARGMGIPVKEFPAEWKRLGKVAGFARNQLMLDNEPDLVIAFKARFDHSLKQGGTEHMIRIARESGVRCVVIDDEPAVTDA